MEEDRFTFEFVENAVRKKTFGILTAIDFKERPHSTGIIYGVSPPDSPFTLYILPGDNYAKVRYIRKNPQVSLVVTFPHYWLRFAPASYVMFRGTADILPFNEPDGIWAMSQSRIGRMNLNTDVEAAGTNMVFIKITPEPTIFCYGLGYGIMEMRSNHANVGYKVIIPDERH